MLKRLTERAWYLPWEEETDRPNLCYLLGERHSLAVDAGNSPAHVRKLYRALEEQGLPLPDFTVLTHWHWDHTFGLGAVHGVGIASAKTNQKLRQVAAWQWTPQAMEERERRGEDIPFCNEHIRREYPRLGEIAVSPAAVELEGSLTLDLGGVRCQLLCQENPHAPDGLLVYVPQEGLVVLGDADCGDFYHLGGGYAPGPTQALARRLSAWDFQWALPSHSGPESKEGELAYLAAQAGSGRPVQKEGAVAETPGGVC